MSTHSSCFRNRGRTGKNANVVVDLKTSGRDRLPVELCNKRFPAACTCSDLSEGKRTLLVQETLRLGGPDDLRVFESLIGKADLTQTEAAGLAELRGDNGGGDKEKGMIEGAKEAFSGDRRQKERSEQD